MRKVYFLAILFLILAIFLSSCGGITPDTNEAKVKGVIQNYGIALNNENWNKAKSYCVYNSNAYFMVEVYEFYVDYSNVGSWTFKIDKIKNIEVNGDYAQADIHIVSTVGSWNEDIYLEKVSSVWKIYNNSYVWY